MDKFPNANIGFSSQNIIDCTGVESYNICNEYIVNPCIGVFSLFLIQPILMPTHEFHSLLFKMNNEHIIFDDVMYRKKIQMNQFINSLLEVLVLVNLSH
jgi:hypothetical protein